MKKIISIIILLFYFSFPANAKINNNESSTVLFSSGGASYATGKTELEAYQNALNKMPKGAKQKRVSKFKSGSLFTCTVYWEK